MISFGRAPRSLRRSLPIVVVASLVAAAEAGFAADARAMAVLYHPGEFVRIARERALVEWHEESETESIVLSVDVDGDAADFALVLATPAGAALATDPGDALTSFARDASVGPGPGVTVAFDAIGLPSARAVRDWLLSHGFVESDGVRVWAEREIIHGEVLTPIRCTSPAADGPLPRTLPALRLSFKVLAPVYPYTEPPPNVADEIAFRSRHGGARLSARAFDLWLTSQRPLRSTQGGFLDWPETQASERLGEQTAWHVHDEEGARVAFTDLTFVPTGVPEAGPLLTPGRAPEPGSPARASPSSTTEGGGVPAGIVALLVAALVGAGALVAAALRRR